MTKKKVYYQPDKLQKLLKAKNFTLSGVSVMLGYHPGYLTERQGKPESFWWLYSSDVDKISQFCRIKRRSFVVTDNEEAAVEVVSKKYAEVDREALARVLSLKVPNMTIAQVSFSLGRGHAYLSNIIHGCSRMGYASVEALHEKYGIDPHEYVLSMMTSTPTKEPEPAHTPEAEPNPEAAPVIEPEKTPPLPNHARKTCRLFPPLRLTRLGCWRACFTPTMTFSSGSRRLCTMAWCAL